MSASNDKKRDTSAIMKRVRSEGTEPEMRFRAALQAAGLTIEMNRSDLPGKPDIVIPSAHLVVFIDGDFWHGGQWRLRGKVALEDQFPQTSAKDYWLKKIRRNMQRDNVTTAILLAHGWKVLRFWESDIRKRLELCVSITCETIAANEGHVATLLPQMTVAEFFAGIGLMRMGLEQSGWQVVFANDIEPQKELMYVEQFPASRQHFISADIHLLSTDTIPTVTLATASFPCNDLSLAGARTGLKGHGSSAFWGFFRILKDMDMRRPPFVLLENVPGLITSHKGHDFAQILQALNTLDYSVDAFMVDACHFTPQSRQRLFVIGMQNSLRMPEESPQETLFPESDTRPKALIQFMQAHQDIQWEIRPLPPQPPTTARIEDILEDLPDDATEWWNQSRATYLLNQMSVKHREEANRMITNHGWSYGTVFRRMRQGKSMAELRIDGIAGCLRTPRGGSGRQIVVKAGYGTFQARLLTPRECARLMGAADYTITVPLNQALFGFGDAVCVPVIDWIATYYLNPLICRLIRSRLLSSALHAVEV